MLSTTLPPAQALLVVLVFGALIGLLFLMVKVVSLKMGGWKQVAERFPMRAINPVGPRYQDQSGLIGNVQSGRGGFFDIQLAQEGIVVTLTFAKRHPCLIPWHAIRRVSISDTSLLVVVDYERSFEFFLPRAVLPTLQAKLSPQLFHEATSPFAAAKAALKDSPQPGWMRAIAGGALKLAEKEYEKEKQKPDGA